MKQFESSDELKKVLGGFFLDFVKRMKEGDPVIAEPGKSLNDLNFVVHLLLSDPPLKIVIDCEEKPMKVSFGDENPKPATATFFVSATNGHRFWLGALNLPNALIKKEVVLKGPVYRMLKVLPAARKAFPIYIKYLKDHGLEDFLPA